MHLARLICHNRSEYKKSKPGLRNYCKAKNLPQVLGGLGVAVVSTSKGLLTDRKARKENLGGEVLAYIY